jgi:hypothetical protein
MYKKLNCCKYCALDFSELNASSRANHSRWCNKNPKSKEYREAPATQLQTKESIHKRSIGIKVAHANGKYDNVNRSFSGWKHKPETIQVIREKALASPHRRLLRSVREYTQIDGTKILLDSSWEEILAKRLDALNIRWVRPKTPLKWVDSCSVEHNYFPDFYLLDYDIFLDPKNPFAVAAQKEKLDIILKTYDNIFLLETKESCESYDIIQ